jgi:hypothetical protein
VSKVGGQAWLCCLSLNIVPLTYSMPVAGDGELVNNAEGDDSWLVTIAERGEASLEADVVRPFMECVMECCCVYD